MSVESEVMKMAKAAKAASKELACCSTEQKNRALYAIADRLFKDADYIKKENSRDLAFAKEKGLSDAMIDRLKINDSTIKAMAEGLKYVAGLEDPVGQLSQSWKRPNGLEISKMCIPLGVIGIIYESRPNVTIDAAGLCLKAGNSVVLRGGSEAMNSNIALSVCISHGLKEAGLPPDAASVIPVRDREAVTCLLEQEEFIDLIIPRGGEGLIRFVVKNSSIPVLKHYKGVCHVYVDEGADFDMAEKICINAKVQRPGVCNSMETMLVHKSAAREFIPMIFEKFVSDKVVLKGCEKTCQISAIAEPATEDDWYAEYLDLVLAVKIVESMDEAIEHMAKYGSSHTEVIVTRDYARARQFVRDVDSSAVLVNASTRFNDGGELGLGAEIGISTSKLHAFGPMGIKELTTSKFVVFGNGQVR